MRSFYAIQGAGAPSGAPFHLNSEPSFLDFYRPVYTMRSTVFSLR